VRILSADWVLPVEGAPIRDGAVAIDADGSIAAVGPAAELGVGERFECCVIVPGFVNAHTHLEYAVYAGFGDGSAFPDWIRTHVQRKELLDVEAMEEVARLGAAECIASGVSTVADASYCGAAATACGEVGLRAVVYLEVFGAGTAHIAERFEANRERVGELPARVTIGISPHAPYTCSVELYEACAALGVPLATHFAESEAEVAWTRSGTGPLPGVRPTSIRELAAHGVLSTRLVAAHGVHLDDEEIALLAEHGVGLAHCPRSNAALGCGIAPIADLLAAGIHVGIGTDSPASAPSFDFFDELRAAVLLARARERRPDALAAEEALELGTLGAARALGLDAEIGSLVPGKRADLTVVSLDGSPYHPVEDPSVAVVFGGSPERVVSVLVDGEETYERSERGGRAWHELQQRAASARARMLADNSSSGPPSRRAPAAAG
jgi:5-methylthioadenosine/S-adenosylhomocysteine deaminase